MYRELVFELTHDNKFVEIQPPCPKNEIDDAEKAVGYTFPKELRALLQEMDGDRYLLLSSKEIIEQSKLNREIQKEYSDEEFAKELDRFIFFGTNGCGDYYCYHADVYGVIDETAIYIWEHEEYCWKRVASSMAELITRYYRYEI
ncbi:MAG: SMI1/KNR4 family protein [Eubacteriales bacterium]